MTFHPELNRRHDQRPPRPDRHRHHPNGPPHSSANPPETVPSGPLPEGPFDLNELQRAPMADLAALAIRLGVKNLPPRARHPLVCELARALVSAAC